MTVAITDLFCGAGGSSLGAEAAGGQLVMAANHWSTAIDVHQNHFPDARHDCADISQADPRRYVPTDILLASPECTNHSQARGTSRRRQDPSFWDMPDPAAERSRATMWDVPRFAEQLDYTAIVVENVVEAVKWRLFPAWWQAMEALGYSGRILSHNSQDHAVPQSRDRVYIVWAKRGLAPVLEMERDARCPRCDAARTVRQVWKNGRTVGRYRAQWYWGCTTCGAECQPERSPAAEIIDWSLDTPSIGDRPRKLADKTRERIWAGLVRHDWVPITTVGAGNGYESSPGTRSRPLGEPVATQTTTSSSALVEPLLFQTARDGRSRLVSDPHPTVTASDDRQSLLVPLRNNGQPSDPTRRPAATVTAGGNHHGLLMRNNTARGNPGQMVTPVDEPTRTMTIRGHQSLLVPYHNGGRARRPDAEPAPTVTTRDRLALLDAQLTTGERDEIIDSCGFRMLEPYEVARAMAFPDHYIPRDLRKRDQIKLAGNAVTPPTMTWIVGRIIQAMEAAS